MKHGFDGQVYEGSTIGRVLIKHASVLLFLATSLTWPQYGARAGEIAAIVEGVNGSVNGIQPMDILVEGRVFELGDGVTLTLGYLRSCIRETITGGRVTIGHDKSKVDNGVRYVEEVDCDGGVFIKPSTRGDELAGAIFRKTNTRRRNLPKPEWIIYGTNPIIRFSKPTVQIIIERLDKEKENHVELDVNGVHVDFSKLGIRLDPGGLYAITNGTATYVVKVSPLAVPDVSLLSRLIPMLTPEPSR